MTPHEQALAAYRSIVRDQRLRTEHQVVQVNRRRLSYERRVDWVNKTPDMLWAREMALCGPLPKRRGTVGCVRNGMGHGTRLLYLRNYDDPACIDSCPSEAVWLDSVVPGRPALAALPFLRLVQSDGVEAAATAYRAIAEERVLRNR